MFELILVEIPIRDHKAENHRACAGLSLREDGEIVDVKWNLKRGVVEVTVLLPAVIVTTTTENE